MNYVQSMTHCSFLEPAKVLDLNVWKGYHSAMKSHCFFPMRQICFGHIHWLCLACLFSISGHLSSLEISPIGLGPANFARPMQIRRHYDYWLIQ